MGAVYHARDVELETPVALKLIHPDLAQNEEAFQRFRNEVVAARRLSHPQIVKTYDLGRAEDGTPFISLKYIQGESLRSWLERRGKASLAEVQRIMDDLLSAVGHAHAQGIVRRDLKPGNILLDTNGGPRLADFGTARLLQGDKHLTRTGETLGTPAYMAPEQISGETIDHRVDIYAAGVIAFELLAGRRPFDADNLINLAMQHVHSPLPALRTFGVDVPTWLQEVLEKATAKNRDSRFPDAESFRKAICGELPKPEKQSTRKFAFAPLFLFVAAGIAALLSSRTHRNAPFTNEQQPPVAVDSVSDTPAIDLPVNTAAEIAPAPTLPTTTLPLIAPVVTLTQPSPTSTEVPSTTVTTLSPPPAQRNAEIYFRLRGEQQDIQRVKESDLPRLRFIVDDFDNETTGVMRSVKLSQIGGDEVCTVPLAVLARPTSDTEPVRLNGLLPHTCAASIPHGVVRASYVRDGRAIAATELVIAND